MDACLCKRIVSFKSDTIMIDNNMCEEHITYDREKDLVRGTVLLSSNTEDEDITVVNDYQCTTIIKEERKPVECLQLDISTVSNILGYMQLEVVTNHLKTIMSGEVDSVRHQLFLIEDERLK